MYTVDKNKMYLQLLRNKGLPFQHVSNANENKLYIFFQYTYIRVLEIRRTCRPRGQKIMRYANNVSNAGPHVRQTFLNDVFTFLTEVL